MTALLLVLLTLLAAGCRKPEPAPEPLPPPEPAPPPAAIAYEELTLELSRTGRSTEQLLAVKGKLPALLQAALEEQDCLVERLTLTFGSSEEATAQALAAGTVEAAFVLPELLTAQMTPTVAVAFTTGLSTDGDSPALWNAGATTQSQAGSVGQRTLLCATATEYGRRLAQRKTLSWMDLEGAVWAVPQTVSPMATLWLSDGFEGRTPDQLPHVTAYDSYESLLRAAAAGQADLVLLPADLRMDYAEAWTADRTRTDALGRSGFGQEQSIWESLPVVGVTAPAYEEVLAISGEALSAQWLADALEEALLALWQSPEGRAVLEEYDCQNLGPVTNEALAAYERLSLLN